MIRLACAFIVLCLAVQCWGMDLKQSTPVTLQIGPFVNAGDGVTPETGLGLADDIEASKNGGEFATVSSASLTHDESGHYRFVASTTTTSALGRLIIKSESSTIHVPVWHSYMILPSNVWDSLYSTDKLQVHVAEITNDLITAAAINADAIGASELAADAIGSSEIATGAIDADAIAAAAIGASELATDAIGSDEVAASAVTKIQAGLSTAANLTILDASVNVIEATLATPANFMADVSALATSAALATLQAAVDALNDLSPAQLASATDDIATLIAALNDLADSEVWAYGTRTLTSGAAPSAGTIAGAVWDATVSVNGATTGTMLNRVHAWGAGKSTKAGDTYTYLDADAVTEVYSATHTTSERTVTAP